MQIARNADQCKVTRAGIHLTTNILYEEGHFVYPTCAFCRNGHREHHPPSSLLACNLSSPVASASTPTPIPAAVPQPTATPRPIHIVTNAVIARDVQGNNYTSVVHSIGRWISQSAVPHRNRHTTAQPIAAADADGNIIAELEWNDDNGVRRHGYFRVTIAGSNCYLVLFGAFANGFDQSKDIGKVM